MACTERNCLYYFYYINRGLERGIDLNMFEQTLVGEQVKLTFVKTHWSPLDPVKTMRPIAEVEVASELLFTTIN